MKRSTEDIENIREYFNLSNSQIKDPDKINLPKEAVESDKGLLLIEESERVDIEMLESTQVRVSSLEKLRIANDLKISKLNKEIRLLARELELDEANQPRAKQKQINSPATEFRSRHSELPLEKKMKFLISVIEKDIVIFVSLLKFQLVRVKKDFIVAATIYLATPLIVLIVYQVSLNLGIENFLINLYMIAIGLICFILIYLLYKYIQEKLEIINNINSRLWQFNQSTSQEFTSTVNPVRMLNNILEGRDSIESI